MTQGAKWLFVMATSLLFLGWQTAIAGDREERGSLAMEMIKIIETEGVLDITIAAAIDSTPKENKALVTKMIAENLDRKAVLASVAKIAVETYTAEEMKALIKFYSTPIGQSILRKKPISNARISKALARIISESVQKRQARKKK